MYVWNIEHLYILHSVLYVSLHMSIPTQVSKNEVSCSSTSNGELEPLVVYILGALLGLSLVLLAAVTAGWVRTCWIIKQRGAMVVTITQSKENKYKSLKFQDSKFYLHAFSGAR